MLSAYGQRHFTTPHIDAMVTRGTSFDNAYGCMLSAPARASLLTGYHDCHPDKWMISKGGQFIPPTDNLSLIPALEKEIDDGDILLGEGDYYLPQVFKKAGYVTAEIGKLEWGFTATRKQMKEHGWDYYYGYLDHVRCHGFYPPFLFDNGEIVTIDGILFRTVGRVRKMKQMRLCGSDGKEMVKLFIRRTFFWIRCCLLSARIRISLFSCFIRPSCRMVR